MLKPILLTLCGILFGAAAAGQVAGQTRRASVPASEVNGTFRMNFTGKYRGNYNEIKILALGKGRLHLAMDLTYPYTMANGELTANVGQLDGEASIARDTAVYASEDGACRLTRRFVRPGTIEVKQDGSDGGCGFGHNVFAGGTYRKVSSARPRFDGN
jgi:hypothetical protein